MSQQINLINPALRKTHDWLTATPLAIATGVMLAIIILVTVSAKINADARLAEAERSVATLKASQDRLLSLSKEVGELKPDQKLADELSNALTLLTLRTEVIAALEGGSFSNSAGFAEYLALIRSTFEEGQRANVFRPDLNAKVVAKILFGALDEMATNWILSPRRYKLAPMADQVLDIFLHGVNVK